MASNKQILDTLSLELQKLIQADIKKKDLIDTGALFRSIKVTAKEQGSKVSLDIIAEDYFEFVDNSYHILDDVTNSNQWQNALETAISQIIENNIKGNKNN